jgi:glyoxylase-like metal-dependent hydrolase (beta-lactamase superfamily II)
VETEIHKLSLGPCNCYLIKEEGLILVDAGSPNQGKKFLKALRELSIEPADISLVLLTHGHWDHSGSANELKTLTGSKVAINQHEKEWVEQGLTPLPPAISLVGRVLALIMKMSMPLAKLSSTSVDIILEDTEFSLGPFGIHGRVLYTPGHSSGSMSLLLDTGEAFVGDSAMNGLPLRIGPGMPAFAEDVGALRESWRLLLTKGAKWIYPAHGKPFKADVLGRLL